ncbi:DUF3046 domain-containing protein [Sinomonas sp. P47F7]|uniref:DUF3046 domain-containing protein n=1 Tax=Sinomonas sp. P47F7 TaxID=3410987 RepID=UPI003BF5BF3C
MRHSDFWRFMEDEFGSAYARVLASTLVLTAAGGRTAVEALQAGQNPRTVWLAVCDMQDVPPDRRLGKDRPLRG